MTLHDAHSCSSALPVPTASIDSLSHDDLARLIDEAASGHLRSAKALRDAFQLSWPVQRMERFLASEWFLSRVRQRQRDRGIASADDDEYDDDDDDDGDGEDGDSANDEDGDSANDDDDNDDAAAATSTTTGPNTQLSGAARFRMQSSDTSASVELPDGARLTLRVQQMFSDRAQLRQSVRAFVAAQRKSVKIDKPTNGGSSFTYICKSATPCTFFVKVRRVNRRHSHVHAILALCGDHGSACTGKPLKRRIPMGVDGLDRNGRMSARAAAAATIAPASVTARDGSLLTLTPRQEFPSRSALRDFVHDVALAQGKRARVDRTASGGNNTTFICTSTTPCAFIVRSLRKRGSPTGAHVVRSFQLTHSATCNGKPSATRRQVLARLTRMDAAPSLALSGADVQAFVKELEGIDVTLRVATDARGELVTRALRDATAGLQQLESLLAHFASLNPMARTDVAFDPQTGTLSRAFLLLPHAAALQSASARVLGLVASELLPTSNVRGTLFELVLRDGNATPRTLAVAVNADNEHATAESYIWFLDACRAGGIALDAPMLCDRNAALLSAAEALPVQFTLVQCTQSLVAGIEERLASAVAPATRALIVRAQAADSAAAYAHTLVALDAADAAVGAQVRSLDANTWAKHGFVGRCALFGCASASLIVGDDVDVTTLPAHVQAARAAGPFELFQSYMERCMTTWYDGKRNAKNWASVSRKLTAFADTTLRALERDARACRVVPSDAEHGIAYVSTAPIATNSDLLPLELLATKCRVNLRANSCTCPAVEQLALPCKHLVAAASFFNADTGASWDVSALALPLYAAKRYFDVHAHVRPIEVPVEDELVRNLNVRVAPTAATNRCSVCHDIGHNRRRCPHNPDAVMPVAGGDNSNSNSSSSSSSSNALPPAAAMTDTELMTAMHD